MAKPNDRHYPTVRNREQGWGRKNLADLAIKPESDEIPIHASVRKATELDEELRIRAEAHGLKGITLGRLLHAIHGGTEDSFIAGILAHHVHDPVNQMLDHMDNLELAAANANSVAEVAAHRASIVSGDTASSLGSILTLMEAQMNHLRAKNEEFDTGLELISEAARDCGSLIDSAKSLVEGWEEWDSHLLALVRKTNMEIGAQDPRLKDLDARTRTADQISHLCSQVKDAQKWYAAKRQLFETAATGFWSQHADNLKMIGSKQALIEKMRFGLQLMDTAEIGVRDLLRVKPVDLADLKDHPKWASVLKQQPGEFPPSVTSSGVNALALAEEVLGQLAAYVPPVEEKSSPLSAQGEKPKEKVHTSFSTLTGIFGRRETPSQLAKPAAAKSTPKPTVVPTVAPMAAVRKAPAPAAQASAPKAKPAIIPPTPHLDLVPASALTNPAKLEDAAIRLLCTYATICTRYPKSGKPHPKSGRTLMVVCDKIILEAGFYGNLEYKHFIQALEEAKSRGWMQSFYQSARSTKECHQPTALGFAQAAEWMQLLPPEFEAKVKACNDEIKAKQEEFRTNFRAAKAAK